MFNFSGGQWCTKFATLALLPAALTAGGRARAEVLAYEGFNYTAGTLLVTGGTGLAGGTGFSAPWDETQGVSDATRIQAESLSYRDALGNVLVTSGGKLQNTAETGNNNQPGRVFGFRRDGVALGATATTPVATWISFLGVRQGQINDFVEGSIENGTFGRGANLTLFDTAATGPEKLNFGENSAFQFPLVDGSDFLRIQRTDATQIAAFRQQFGKSGTLAMSAVDRWQVNAAQVNGNITAQATPNYVDPEDGTITTAREWQENPVDGRFRARFTDTPFAGQAGLMVARIDHFGGATPRDRVYVWLNPNLNAAPSTNTADAVIDLAAVELRATDLALSPFNQADGNTFSFDRLRLFAGNASGARKYADWLVDEFRVGTSFADVAPIVALGTTGVPEPGSLALGGAALAAGIAFRRTRWGG